MNHDVVNNKFASNIMIVIIITCITCNLSLKSKEKEG